MKMDNKILMYPKSHVVIVPDNWYKLDIEEQKNYCEDYCQGADFVFDDFHNLKKVESVERLEKMYGKAK